MMQKCPKKSKAFCEIGFVAFGMHVVIFEAAPTHKIAHAKGKNDTGHKVFLE